MCDITLCADHAVIFDPHFDAGWVPGDGINLCFRELLGAKRAAFALLTSQSIDAKTALEWGMVNEVHPKDKLISRAYEIADHIMKQHRMTRRMSTAVVRRPWKERVTNDLDAGIGLQMFSYLAKASHRHEGALRVGELQESAENDTSPVMGGSVGMRRRTDSPPSFDVPRPLYRICAASLAVRGRFCRVRHIGEQRGRQDARDP